MARIDLGQAGFLSPGDYSPTASYRTLHVVKWTNGDLYECTSEEKITGIPPTNKAYWRMFLSAEVARIAAGKADMATFQANSAKDAALAAAGDLEKTALKTSASKWQFYSDANPSIITPTLGSTMEVTAKQNTTLRRSGLNLAAVNQTTQTNNGVTITFNADGTATLNGTVAGAAAYLYWWQTTMIDLLPGTYTVSFIPMSGEVSTLSGVTVNYRKDSDPAIMTLDSLSTAKTKTYTFSTAQQYNRVFLFANTGITFTNYRVGIQLELGATATPWEAFIASDQYTLAANVPVNVPAIAGSNILYATQRFLLGYNMNSMNLLDQYLTKRVTNTGPVVVLDALIGGLPLEVTASAGATSVTRAGEEPDAGIVYSVGEIIPALPGRNRVWDNGTGDTTVTGSQSFMEMDIEQVELAERALTADVALKANTATHAARATQASNATNAGVEQAVLSVGRHQALRPDEASGIDLFSIDLDGNMTVSLDSTVRKAGDMGFSMNIGLRSKWSGKTLLLYRDEPYPFAHLLIVAGSTWGTQYGAVATTTFSQVNDKLWSADFDDLFKLITDAGKRPTTWDGDMFIAIYDNSAWDMTVFQAQTVKYAYSLFSPVPGAMVSASTAKVADHALTADAARYVTGNVLYGKKWAACGDSFTAGDTENTSDTKGKLVYPRFIAERNNMTVINEAIGGSVMALDKTYVSNPGNVPINTRSPFSYQRYQNLPLDIDYITLWFGINDATNTNLGALQDTTNLTFYGAWNVVLPYLINKHPYAKIGLIVTPYANTEFREAVRDIGKRWGLPYLDMTDDLKVPMMFYRGAGYDAVGTANDLRTNAFRISSTNFHPNEAAHRYMSTFIENFLRSL